MLLFKVNDAQQDQSGPARTAPPEHSTPSYGTQLWQVSWKIISWFCSGLACRADLVTLYGAHTCTHHTVARNRATWLQTAGLHSCVWHHLVHSLLFTVLLSFIWHWGLLWKHVHQLPGNCTSKSSCTLSFTQCRGDYALCVFLALRFLLVLTAFLSYQSLFLNMNCSGLRWLSVLFMLPRVSLDAGVTNHSFTHNIA